MRIKSFTILLFLLALLSATDSFAQIRPRQKPGQRTTPTNPAQQNPQRTQQQQPNRSVQDTARVKKPGSILDDTTKALYGPKTTLRLYENDVLEGIYREQRIDTTIQNIQNQRYWFQDTAYYQHLGNIGTASQPLLYKLPTRIGARFGKNAFDRYAYDSNKINYFDTRSPYSHLYYVQGQRGEQVFEVIYARNITERFNFGVAYQIIAADKQFGTTSLRDDGLIDNQAVKAFTHYRSKNNNYNLFSNYTHLNHEQIETGGVKPADADDTPDSLFRYEDDLVFLEQAVTDEIRHNYHLLHMLKIVGENLKAYHRFDWRKQNTTYRDDALPKNAEGALDFYPEAIYSSARTLDKTNYREFENEFGLSGNTSISYYKAYIKQRNSKVDYSAIQTIKPDTNAIGAIVTDDLVENQVFIGGKLRFNYQDKYLLFGEGEYQLVDNYRLQAGARFKGLEFVQSRVRQSPSLMEQYLISNHFTWNNRDFKTTITDQSRASLRQQFGTRLFLKLSGAYTTINRLVVYNTDAEPAQLTGNQQLLEVQFANHLRLGSIHFENFINYTNTDEAPAIRVPEWLVNSKLYFQGYIFKNALFTQIGVEMFLPTGYKADAYMPVTQQFYLQNDFTTKTYPVFDVFLTADIKTVNVFVKMAHANYDLWEPGYYETPGYPGLRRSLTFGLKWMFFD
ncbi:putative porin [Pontibacter pudoricolor]|uniref:putative porin n=1 Tax=Pontibacter pudoricolor TaxID=2694930 RepID=UPI0013912D8C|nr:putative porin [Pontibacter pudoricolor]